MPKQFIVKGNISAMAESSYSVKKFYLEKINKKSIIGPSIKSSSLVIFVVTLSTYILLSG